MKQVAPPVITHARVNSEVDVLARPGDQIIGELNGQRFQPQFEVLMARKSHIIVREIGKKGAQKIEMPTTWNSKGRAMPMIAEVPFALYAKKDAPGPIAASDAPKRQGPKRGEGPTKMDKCREIFAANTGKTKAEIVALFISDAGCTPAGANTYYLTIKNKPAA